VVWLLLVGSLSCPSTRGEQTRTVYKEKVSRDGLTNGDSRTATGPKEVTLELELRDDRSLVIDTESPLTALSGWVL